LHCALSISISISIPLYLYLCIFHVTFNISKLRR
jgi:hypothetical protein